MANQGTERNQPSNRQTYGVPIYAADWIPKETVRSKIDKDQEESEDGESSLSSSSSSRSYIVLAGGGGEGRSGIPNAILVCRVDLHTSSLSENPVGKLVVGADLPYRMAVHPGGDGLVCALQNSCRMFDWENIMSSNEDNQGNEESGKVVEELKDVGQQLALSFNHEGSVLAAGGEDGTLRVFEWPSMKTLINESKAHTSVKNLTFSQSGKFLVSLGTPLCRVWEVNASTAIASLSKEKDEMFAFCRFSTDMAGNEVLYIAAMTERGGSIITWDTTSWKRKSSNHVTKNSISAFNVSGDGKLFALGTIEGDVLIIDATRMKTIQVVKKAHLGLVTALTFSHDSRGLVSASFDSSVRLTLIEQTHAKAGGLKLWLVLLVLLISLAMYYFMTTK